MTMTDESSMTADTANDNDELSPSEEYESDSAENEMTESPEDFSSDDVQINTTSVLEAVLFCADEPVPARKLAEIIDVGGVKEVREAVDELNARYRQMNCAFRVESLAGGYLMLTLPAFNSWLRQLLKVRGETKLSPAALETLAIVAYKQPILRVDVEAIRGVAAGEMLRQLMEKGLIKIVGRAEELGRPLLYGTTKKFLELFGLNSLKDLPSVEDLKRPD